MKKRSNPSAQSDAFVPRQVLDRAVSRLMARGGVSRRGLEKIALLHAEERKVQKDGVTVSNIEFWSPSLRPFTLQTLEVRFDAAASDRGRLSEVFVRLVTRRGANWVRCAPRLVMQSTLDRDAVNKEAWAYQQDLRGRVERGAETFAELVRGVGAKQRQAALHQRRRAQGRAGQQQSGYAAPRPEVDAGVRQHQDEVLKRKVKNRQQKVSRSKTTRRNSARSESVPSSGPGWDTLAKAADGKPGGVHRRSR